MNGMPEVDADIEIIAKDFVPELAYASKTETMDSLGVDSLACVEFVMELEVKFGLDLDELDDNIEKMTLEQIGTAIKEKLQRRELDKPDRSGIK